MGYCFICGRDTNQPGSLHFFATQEDILHYCDKHANKGRKLFAMIHNGSIDKNKLKKIIDKCKISHNEEKENKMSENYIMLNGKRVDLTEEQIEKLGLKVEKDVFEKQNYNEKYYWITSDGQVVEAKDVPPSDMRYNVANYCTDEALMQQRALHETLSRLLWRFSMQNDGDKIDWNTENDCKFFICYNHYKKQYDTDFNNIYNHLCTYFYSEEIAKRAIDEIVLPFMKEHPEFVW